MSLINLKKELQDVMSSIPKELWGGINYEQQMNALNQATTFNEVIKWLIGIERVIFQLINADAKKLDKNQSLFSLHESKDKTLESMLLLDKKLALLNAIVSEYLPEIVTEIEQNNSQRHQEIIRIANNMGVPNEALLRDLNGYQEMYKNIKNMLLLHYVKCYEIGPLNAQFISNLSNALVNICPEDKTDSGYLKFSLSIIVAARIQTMTSSRPTNIGLPFYRPTDQNNFDENMRSGFEALNKKLPESYELSEQTFANISNIPSGEKYASPSVFKITFIAPQDHAMFKPVGDESREMKSAHHENLKQQKSNYFIQKGCREMLCQMESGIFFVFKNEARVYYMPAQLLVMHETAHMRNNAAGELRSGITEDDAPEIFSKPAYGGSGTACVEEFWVTIGDPLFSEYALTVDARFTLDGVYEGRVLYDNQNSVHVVELKFAQSNQLMMDALRKPINQQGDKAVAESHEHGGNIDDEESVPLNEVVNDPTCCFSKNNCTIS